MEAAEAAEVETSKEEAAEPKCREEAAGHLVTEADSKQEVDSEEIDNSKAAAEVLAIKW